MRTLRNSQAIALCPFSNVAGNDHIWPGSVVSMAILIRLLHVPGSSRHVTLGITLDMQTRKLPACYGPTPVAHSILLVVTSNWCVAATQRGI